MKAMLRHSHPLAYILIVALLSLSLPRGRAEAAIATTESVLSLPADDQTERARVRAFLNRDEVRAQIEAYGISAEEAIARVDSLTDREIALIAGELDRLPAGGYGYYCCGAGAGAGAIVLLAVAVLIVVGLIMGIKWIFERLSNSKEQPQPQPQEQKAD